MAVSVVATSPFATGGATGTSAVSATPTLPSGSVSGHRVYIYSASTAAPATPTGWTLVASVSVGGGTLGAATGPRFVSAFYRDYDGVWTMPSVSMASHAAPTIIAWGVTKQKDAGETWATPIAASGSDTSLDTSTSITGGSFTTVSGGLIYAAVGYPGQPGATSSPAIAQAGATLGTQNSQPAAGGFATGNDAFHASRWAQVTTGATGAPSYTATTANARTAGGLFVHQGVAGGSSPASSSGSITLGGTVTGQAPVMTTGGGITLGGTTTATVSGTPATASGSITLGGTATARAPITAGGSITLDGVATAQAPAVTGGSITLGGTATARAPVTAGGSITLGGTATARAPVTVAGSITLGGATAAGGGGSVSSVGSIALGGTVAAQVPIAALGGIILGGSAAAHAPITALGGITFGGLAAAHAPITALGGITLGGTASAGSSGSASAAGSINLDGGTVLVHAPVTSSGAITLGGTGSADVLLSVGGEIILGGATTVAVPATIHGLIFLSGIANALGPVLNVSWGPARYGGTVIEPVRYSQHVVGSVRWSNTLIGAAEVDGSS